MTRSERSRRCCRRRSDPAIRPGDPERCPGDCRLLDASAPGGRAPAGPVRHRHPDCTGRGPGLTTPRPHSCAGREEPVAVEAGEQQWAQSGSRSSAPVWWTPPRHWTSRWTRTCTPASRPAGTASAWSSRPPTGPVSPRSPSPTRSARTPPGCPRTPTPSAGPAQRTELTLRVAAEVEVVQPDGWLAWPADLGHLEAVSVAVSRLPLADGPLGPREVRALLAAGELTAEQVAEIAGDRHRPGPGARLPLRAHPAGPPAEPARPGRPGRRRDRPRTCSARSPPPAGSTGTVVEISEAWRSPSPRLVAMLRAADVTLVAASDARYAAEVGRWQYLRRV